MIIKNDVRYFDESESAPGWVAACFVCGHFIYWDDESSSWCHLHNDCTKMMNRTHLAKPGGHPTEPCLFIEEEP